MTLAEREEISRGIASDLPMRTIAIQLGRSPSTISREVKRDGSVSRYRATQADQVAWDRAYRPKRRKLAGNRLLNRLVAAKLQVEWSPEQIAGWLKTEYPGQEHK